MYIVEKTTVMTFYPPSDCSAKSVFLHPAEGPEFIAQASVLKAAPQNGRDDHLAAMVWEPVPCVRNLSMSIIHRFVSLVLDITIVRGFIHCM